MKDVNQLARLLKLSSSLRAQDREKLRAYILRKFPKPENDIPIGGGTGETSQRSKATRGVTCDGDQRPSEFTKRAELCALKIRSLIEAAAGWDKVGALAYELVKLKPSPKNAAQLVELAFLHGDDEDLITALQASLQLGKGFYSFIHPALRNRIVERTTALDRQGVVIPLLLKHKDSDILSPLERLTILDFLFKSSDPSKPYMYFSRYRHELEAASQGDGHIMGWSHGELMLKMGKTALDLGYENSARTILSQISQEDRYYDQALNHLLKCSSVKQHVEEDHFIDLLLSEPTVEGRLGKLSELLDKCRRLGGFQDFDRPAMNQLLLNCHDWLPQDPEAIMAFSDILVANRDLSKLLPNLMAIYNDNAIEFKGNQWERCLWSAWLEIKPQNPQEIYFFSVASFHNYVHTQGEFEKILWQAKDGIEKAWSSSGGVFPASYKDLHGAGLAFVSKHPKILERDRERLIAQLRIAVDSTSMRVEDLDRYLETERLPTPEALEHLRLCARAFKDATLGIKVIVRRAQSTHLINRDLVALWQLALDHQRHDLAWRIATVLKAREALIDPVSHAWGISGEHRTKYPVLLPSLSVMNSCLMQYPEDQQRLIQGLLQVGHKIPELLYLLDRRGSSRRAIVPRSGSNEELVWQALKKVPWLTMVQKQYRYTSEGLFDSTAAPRFAQVLPSTVWSLLVAKLSETLGVTSWGFNVSTLHSHISEIFPRYMRLREKGADAHKIGRWLKKLNARERSAWNDVLRLANRLDPKESEASLATFIVRMSTVIYQNHYEALTSLKSMRAPVMLIWDLENFIVSEAYSNLRLKIGTAHRVLVPKAFERLESILKRPH